MSSSTTSYVPIAASATDNTSAEDRSASYDGSLKINTEEDIVNVSNFLLLKHVTENNDKELFLVGTCIQELTNLDLNVESVKLGDDKWLDNGTSSEDIEKLSQRLFFDYRFNDLAADNDNGWIKTRRVEMNKCNAKKNFQVYAPLKIETIYDFFPFKIVTASVTIELSSSAVRDQRRRANLLLGKDYKAMNVAIQPVQHLDIIKYLKKKEDGATTHEPTKEADFVKKMDDSNTYDFITPFPEVAYQYDKKKKYCPKFKVSFYMVESGISKFVQIICPMLLIAILNTIQVLDLDVVENTNYLSNAATFALTAVFILPSIIGNSNGQDLYSMNNLYIILIFVGLALSSVPAELIVHTDMLSISGMSIIWLSFIMPIIGCILYYKHCAAIRRISPKQMDRFNSNAPRKVIESDPTTKDKENVTTVKKANVTTVDKVEKEAKKDLYEVDDHDESIIVHG